MPGVSKIQQLAIVLISAALCAGPMVTTVYAAAEKQSKAAAKRAAAPKAAKRKAAKVVATPAAAASAIGAHAMQAQAAAPSDPAATQAVPAAAPSEVLPGVDLPARPKEPPPLTTDRPVPGAARLQVDPRTPEYRKIDRLAGKIRSVGSSTLSNLLNRWASDFKLIYPEVEIEVTGGGSSMALPALLEGRAELAPVSRAMKKDEIAKFQAKFGYEPTQLIVGLDALAVYVNKNNPLKQMTLKQLDAIYSITRKRGGEQIRYWGQLGLDGDWREREIVLKGPSQAMGMHSVFREMALEGGDFRYDLRGEPVATSIVQGVGATDAAIGFASYFYDAKRVRTLAIAAKDEGPFYEPTHANCVSGAYPMTRFLYVYVNKPPGKLLNALTAHFLAFTCSKQGQETAARDGNYPLTADILYKECLVKLK
jgi:phosphate transport system substrate-binding protein